MSRAILCSRAAAARWQRAPCSWQKRAHTVVYCMGLTDLYETEGV